MDTPEKNQKAFTGQSQGFSKDGDTYADADELVWMLEDLPVSADARALHPGEFESCFRLMGLDLVSARTRVLENEFREWMDFSLTGKEHREEILGAARAELSGGPKTGLSPYMDGAQLCFNQLGLSIVGRKRA